MTTLYDALVMIYGENLKEGYAVTKRQAIYLGIPYPLVNGWFHDNRDMVVEDLQYFLSLSTADRCRKIGITPTTSVKSDATIRKIVKATEKKKGKKQRRKEQETIAHERRVKKYSVISPSDPSSMPVHTDAVVKANIGIFTNTIFSNYIKLAEKDSTYEYVTSDKFLRTQAWLSIRYLALAKSDGRCCLCGSKASSSVTLNVDHIKPRKLFPQLALTLDNLQVLCSRCNKGKLNGAMIDHRSFTNLEDQSTFH